MHIGIVTCEIVRKEISEVIRETGVADLFFVLPDTANSVTVVLYQQVIERFSSEFAEDGWVLKEKTLDKIEKEIRARNLKNSVIIKVLELQLHDHPHELLLELEANIKRMGSVVDFIVLGYGLCGSTEDELERVISKSPVPVLIPRDSKGRILNNCIEIALSKDKVQSLLNEEVGTFFMTPAGAAIIQEPQVILESTINIMAGRMNTYAVGDTKRILKLMKNHYNRVVKIWYSEADDKNEEYAQTVKNFAKKFNLEIKPVKGSSEIMCDTVEKSGIVEREF